MAKFREILRGRHDDEDMYVGAYIQTGFFAPTTKCYILTTDKLDTHRVIFCDSRNREIKDRDGKLRRKFAPALQMEQNRVAIKAAKALRAKGVS